MNQVSFAHVLNSVFHQEMEENENIFIIGSDISFGGRAGVTQGLVQRFGSERVIDTPINEEIFVGIAIGAAQAGLRPVVEIAHSTLPLVGAIDFFKMGIWSKICGDNFSLPIVVRVRMGREAGHELSASIISFLTGLHGVTVVAPSTHHQAKGTLLSALRHNSPVIFLEYSALYRKMSEAPLSTNEIPFGKAEYATVGKDISIISYAHLTDLAIKAAKEYSAKGVCVEVLDLISLKPLDVDKIIETARKTKKVIVLSDESNSIAGFPYRIYHFIKEKLPETRVIIMGAKEVVIPFGPLREAVSPTFEDLRGVIELNITH